MVVMEKSSYNDVDANAMTEAAFARLAEGVEEGTATVAVAPGAHEGAGEAGVRFAAAAWRDR
eukprot:7892775-Pyramimonas_sp.AAC.1